MTRALLEHLASEQLADIKLLGTHVVGISQLLMSLGSQQPWTP